MNKNRIIAITSSLIVYTSLFTGCGEAGSGVQNKVSAEKQITLRLADNQNEEHVTVRADREFAKIVEEKSNGRIKVDVYAGGQLGDEKSVIEQVQFGAIDLMRVSVSTLAEFDNEIRVLSLPYIYRDQEHMFKVLDGPIGDKIMYGLESFKITGLCWFDAGARNFYNTKRYITTPDDLKGMRIRVQENKHMIDMVKILGASAIPMAYGEVYSGLQSGVIDGAENNWLSYLSANHYQVAKHITVDELTRIPEMIAASKINLDRLSKDDQEIIRQAAKEASIYQRQEWVKAEEEAKKKVIESGVIVTQLNSKEALKERVMPLYEIYGKDYKELVQSIVDTR